MDWNTIFLIVALALSIPTSLILLRGPMAVRVANRIYRLIVAMNDVALERGFATDQSYRSVRDRMIGIAAATPLFAGGRYPMFTDFMASSSESTKVRTSEEDVVTGFLLANDWLAQYLMTSILEIQTLSWFAKPWSWKAFRETLVAVPLVWLLSRNRMLVSPAQGRRVTEAYSIFDATMKRDSGQPLFN